MAIYRIVFKNGNENEAENAPTTSNTKMKKPENQFLTSTNEAVGFQK
jgi:hypothetical protein